MGGTHTPNEKLNEIMMADSLPLREESLSDRKSSSEAKIEEPSEKKCHRIMITYTESF